MKKKVSFDFDDTLSFEDVQEYAWQLVESGIEIHIVTSRYEDVTRYPFHVSNHDDLNIIAIKLAIDPENIHFTNMENKYHFFEKNRDFIWHLDNDECEISLMKWHRNKQNKYIETNLKTIGILLEYGYQDICNELLGLTNETKN
jgi:hypothetical protein